MARLIKDQAVVVWDIITDKKETFHSYAMMNKIKDATSDALPSGYKSRIGTPLWKHRYFVKPAKHRSRWPSIEKVRVNYPICLRYKNNKKRELRFLSEKHLAKFLRVPKRIIDKLLEDSNQSFGNYLIKHHADTSSWLDDVDDEYTHTQLMQMGEEQPRDFIVTELSTNNRILFCDYNAAAQHIKCSVEDLKEGLLTEGKVVIDDFIIEWFTGETLLRNLKFYIHAPALDHYVK